MTLPAKELDQKRFWAIGGRTPRSRKLTNSIQRAMAAEREDYGSLLGHKRDHSHLRPRAKRKRG
jgi:hypothetical protein